MSRPVTCESSEAWGTVPCELAAGVLIEFMPEQHRASHATAGNRGAYPHNGALRLLVCELCAELLCDSDALWCERLDEFEQHNPKHVSVAPPDGAVAVSLPRDVEAVRYVDASGNVRLARGSADELAAELEAAGYTVAREES